MAISPRIDIRPTGSVTGSAKTGTLPGFVNDPYGNPALRYRDILANKPSNINIDNSRITFATDICFVDGYTLADSNHLVLAARVNPADIVDDVGGSAWAGIAAGAVFGKARVLAEERVFKGNYHQWCAKNGALTVQKGLFPANQPVPTISEHKWYRFILDSIKVGGIRAYEIRVHEVIDELSNTLGPLIANSGTIWCSESGGHANTTNLCVAGVNTNGTGNFIVGRSVAYWSNYNEWVPNP